MECLSETAISEFFLSYQISDNTARLGEINFYLVEKFDNQTELLDIQEKCEFIYYITINNYNNYIAIEAKNDGLIDPKKITLERSINLIQEKVLKGINCFKFSQIDSKKSFHSAIRLADNSIVFIIAAIAFVVQHSNLN